MTQPTEHAPTEGARVMTVSEAYKHFGMLSPLMETWLKSVTESGPVLLTPDPQPRPDFAFMTVQELAGWVRKHHTNPRHDEAVREAMKNTYNFIVGIAEGVANDLNLAPVRNGASE